LHTPNPPVPSPPLSTLRGTHLGLPKSYGSSTSGPRRWDAGLALLDTAPDLERQGDIGCGTAVRTESASVAAIDGNGDQRRELQEVWQIGWEEQGTEYGCGGVHSQSFGVEHELEGCGSAGEEMARRTCKHAASGGTCV
jgi:hypothetical protein